MEVNCQGSNDRRGLATTARAGPECWGLALGKLAEAEQEIATALEVAKEIGNPPQLWKTHAALGDLRNAQDQANEARQPYRDALTVIDGVASALTDKSLRETFLNSPQVQTIRQEAGNVS